MKPQRAPKPATPTIRLLRLCPLLAALLLAGCTSVSPDGLRADVAQHTQARLPAGAQLPALDAHAQQQAQAQISLWLASPLDADTAVRIALLNNPSLQVQLAQLGMADAQRVQALTLPNPSLGLVQLITLPWRSRWQGWHMEQATLSAAQQVLLLATSTRRAWLNAVAAQQALAAHERLHEAAALGGELARRMAATGNFSKLAQARGLALQQQAAAQLSRARLQAQLSREQLGLWGPQLAFQLPEQLPPLPAATELRAGDDVEATALRERLDLVALRRELDTSSDRQHWATLGAVFGDVGLGYSRNSSTELASGHRDTTRGWSLDVPLPLFDWGQAASGMARHQLQHSAARLREQALLARSEARSTWLRHRTAWDLAQQQHTEVLPLARLMQDESMYRYNGMLISVWQLLAQARVTTQAVLNATEAQRDFWLAEADLQLALTGTSPGMSLGPATALPSATPDNSPEH